MATKSRNRVELTLDKKLSLIKAVEGGKSHRKLAEEFSIGKNTSRQHTEKEERDYWGIWKEWAC